MWLTYASIVSVFSSKLKDLHTWNNCSLVLSLLEYCCINKFCSPCQSTFIGSNEWYHSLASPNSVKQNLWTLTPSKWCAVIQSLVQTRWASASSSGFPQNSGLNETCCPGCWPAGACAEGARWSSCCCCCWPVTLLALGLEGD